MGKNKCLRYLLVIVLLALCSACSKKEEANTRSSFANSLEFLEKMALQCKDSVPSFSLSYEHEREGIWRFEVRYIGALEGCDTRYDILNERLFWGWYEESLHLTDKLTVFSDGVKLGSYFGLDNEYNITLCDCGIVMTDKITNISTTISFSDGVPDYIFVWADSTGGTDFGFSKRR